MEQESKGFCREGSKHEEDVVAYSISIRSVCQEWLGVYVSVVESFTSGNVRFRRRGDYGSRNVRRVPRACLPATPTSLWLLHGPQAVHLLYAL